MKDTSRTLSIVNLTNAATPVATGSVVLDGPANDIAVANGRAYVANAFGGFSIVDIQDPAAPTILGSYDSFGDGLRITVVGTLAYFTTGTGLFQVVDVSTPNAPTQRGSVTLPTLGFDIKVNGNTAWVSGLVTVSIANPDSPTITGYYQHILPTYKLVVQGTKGVSVGQGGLQTLDVSNPAAPVRRGAISDVGFATAAAISGTLAFVTDVYYGLRVVDLSDVTAPQLIGSGLNLGGAFDIQLVGATAYVASGNGFAIVDISTPAAPQLLGQAFTGQTSSVQVIGNLAYTTSASQGLAIVDIRNPTNPGVRSAFSVPGFAEGLAVAGTHAYVTYNLNNSTENRSGLAIFDVSDTAAPKLLADLRLPVNAAQVTLVGDLLYVAVGTGVRVIDVADPARPIDRGGVTGFPASQTVVSGATLYATGGDAGLFILQMHPEQVPASTTLIALAGGTLTSHDTTTTLTVEASAVTSSATITYTPGLANEIPLPKQGTLLRSFTFSGQDATGSALFTLNTPATLTLTLGAAMRQQAQATRLHLYMWDGQTWQDMPLQVSSDGKQVTASITKLTSYALTQETGDAQLHVYLPLVQEQ